MSLIKILFLCQWIVGFGSVYANDTVLKELNQAREESDWARMVILIKKHRELIPDATRSLVFAYLSAGRREEAMSELNRLIEKSNRADYKLLRTTASEQFLTDEAAAFYHQAVYRKKTLRFEEAKQALQEAIKLEKDNTLLLRHMGHLSLVLDQSADAAEKLRLAHRLDPSKVETIWLLGRALWLTGERNEGLQLLKTANQKSPEIVKLWLLQALSGGGHSAALKERLNQFQWKKSPLLTTQVLQNEWVKLSAKEIQQLRQKNTGQLLNLSRVLDDLNSSTDYLWVGFYSVETLRTQLNPESAAK